MKELAKQMRTKVSALQLTPIVLEYSQGLSAAQSTLFTPVKKPRVKKPAAPHTTAPKLVGVAPSNGKDRQQKDGEFHDFQEM